MKIRFTLAVIFLLLLRSYGGQPAASGTFSVMTYNLHQYARDGKKELKQEPERLAVIALIAKERPDVLAVEEIGDAPVFKQFRKELQKAGLDYPHAELLERGRMDMNLAVLSRFPIVSVQHHTNDWYSIGKDKVRVLRGFLDVDIQVNPHYRFRLLTAHLKSKVSHPLGQTEMRRNEARLLGKIIRGILDEDPEVNLLVAGDFNDDYNSAPLKEIGGRRGGEMTDLRPADSSGAAWTYFQSATDNYCRFDYVFVSRGMLPEAVRGQTRVVSDPLVHQASDHRPVTAVFCTVNQ